MSEEKKVLIFAPDSPHTKKFINMIDGILDYQLILQQNDLNLDYGNKTSRIKNKSIQSLFQIMKSLWFSPFKYDVVHLHFINFTAFIVSLLSIKPIIVTAWGSDVLVVPEKKLLYRMMIKFVLWRSEIITANSSQTMRVAINILAPKRKVNKVHFGINQYCKKTPHQEKENLIYSPRNHAPLYNIEKVIHSFEEFYKNNPSWKLVISGREDPTKTPQLKKMAQGLPIEFTGWITEEEHALWLSKAKIVVSIPSSDALSVTLMEAIYSNCVCFVSDLNSNKEVITEGMNGFISTQFDLHEKIDIKMMEKLNEKISETWTFEYQKKSFLKIYKII